MKMKNKWFIFFDAHLASYAVGCWEKFCFLPRNAVLIFENVFARQRNSASSKLIFDINRVGYLNQSVTANQIICIAVFAEL